MPTYDPDKINESKFEAFPPGIYDCEVAEVRSKMSSNGEQISIWFEQVGTGKKIGWDNLHFYGGGLGIADKKSKILGIKPGDDGKMDFPAEDLIHKRAKITWANEKFNGKTSLRPDFNSDGFGYEPLESAKKEEKDIPF